MHNPSERIPGHDVSGTHYGAEAVVAYSGTTHLTNRQRFLSGFVENELADVHGASIIDIGAGAGPWSIYAAQHGASEVLAIDYQIEMVHQATRAVSEAKLSDIVTVMQGDAATLPAKENNYDTALSIQVGCNLPQGVFSAHFSEIFRVLKKGGKAIVTAPASFGTVFSKGAESVQEIAARINETTQSDLKKSDDINLATFKGNGEKLVLVQDEKELVPGEEIWRKLQGLMVPNFYHPTAQYEQEFRNNNFKIVKKFDQGFGSDVKRNQFNSGLPADEQLGHSYVHNAPFIVWVVEK